MTIRERVIDHIKMLAHSSAQLEYERNVPIADVPAELVCGFCDDLYHPKSPEFVDSFSEAELRRLAELYGSLTIAARDDVHTVAELLKSRQWRAVIALAKDIHVQYSRGCDLCFPAGQTR